MRWWRNRGPSASSGIDSPGYSRTVGAHTRCAGGTAVEAGEIAEGDASLMPHARQVGSAGTTSRRAVLAGGAGGAAAFLAPAAPHAQAQSSTPEASAPA